MRILPLDQHVRQYHEYRNGVVDCYDTLLEHDMGCHLGQRSLDRQHHNKQQATDHVGAACLWLLDERSMHHST